jgi:spermidine/putrescine transport system permease protein
MPYVLLSVMPRLTQLNPNLYEAGLDLGAKPIRTLLTVIMPQLVPGMISGFGLAFTLSLDDYVISKFINGNVQTISTLIYSATKKGIPPVWRAVSSLIFIVVLVILIFINVKGKKKKAGGLL